MKEGGLQVNITLVWTVITVVLSLGIGLQIGSIIAFKSEAPKYGVETNSYTDLFVMGVALIFISLFRHFGMLVARPIAEERLKLIEPGCAESKIDKNARAMVSSVWYSFTTVISLYQIYGLVYFWGHPYLPTLFLGGCNCEEMISKWPYYPVTTGIKCYYMILLAHHVNSLIELINGYKLRNDVAEMALHHLATVSCMLMSYFGNQVATGITVLAAHNVGDIFINLAKFCRDLKYVRGIWADLLFVSLFISWFIPRVILIGICVLPAGFYTRHWKPGVYPQSIKPLA